MKKLRRWRVNSLSGRGAALGLLGVLFLTGSIAGCMAVGLLNPEDGGALLTVLEGYIAALKQGEGSVGLLPVLWQVVRVPLAAFLLGLTAMGVVGLPVLFAVRGFGMGYAVAVLYRLMGASGLGLGLCLFGVSALLWLPALLNLGVSGLVSAYGLLRRVTGDGRYPLAAAKGRYWLSCGLCGCAVLACAGVECLLVPALVRLIT